MYIKRRIKLEKLERLIAFLNSSKNIVKAQDFEADMFCIQGTANNPGYVSQRMVCRIISCRTSDKEGKLFDVKIVVVDALGPARQDPVGYKVTGWVPVPLKIVNNLIKILTQ